MSTQIFPANEIILTQGQRASAAYLIEEGDVDVYLHKEGKTVTLATLGPGALFGETALLGDHDYGAYVKAGSHGAKVRIISAADFSQKLEACDPAIKAIVLMLVDRLRKTNQALVDSETREFIEISWV